MAEVAGALVVDAGGTVGAVEGAGVIKGADDAEAPETLPEPIE